MNPLPLSFYRKKDVVAIARTLIGKRLLSTIGGVLTGGIIIETEAYKGPQDRASHAFGGRRTERNEAMYAPGGISYVYLCYGMHHLLNIVTHHADVPHAVLIRAIRPTHGIKTMEQRRKGKKPLISGPGTVCQALGITRAHNGISLQGPLLWLEEGDEQIGKDAIRATARIGIDYAGPDAKLPWRFQL